MSGPPRSASRRNHRTVAPVSGGLLDEGASPPRVIASTPSQRSFECPAWTRCWPRHRVPSATTRVADPRVSSNSRTPARVVVGLFVLLALFTPFTLGTRRTHRPTEQERGAQARKVHEQTIRHRPRTTDSSSSLTSNARFVDFIQPTRTVEMMPIN